MEERLLLIEESERPGVELVLLAVEESDEKESLVLEGLLIVTEEEEEEKEEEDLNEDEEEEEELVALVELLKLTVLVLATTYDNAEIRYRYLLSIVSHHPICCCEATAEEGLASCSIVFIYPPQRSAKHVGFFIEICLPSTQSRRSHSARGGQ